MLSNIPLQLHIATYHKHITSFLCNTHGARIQIVLFICFWVHFKAFQLDFVLEKIAHRNHVKNEYRKWTKKRHLIS